MYIYIDTIAIINMIKTLYTAVGHHRRLNFHSATKLYLYNFKNSLKETSFSRIKTKTICKEVKRGVENGRERFLCILLEVIDNNNLNENKHSFVAERKFNCL